ncbi:hypothetical protein BKA58DRAFT_373285 [Alternaria rosae]|uniref:uncharacterized protein n=1 Tax=Alternaria rosae TaxID=1187941 RepID=UPI001E8D3187|nr:uncharacterized protein BKA58DRAFT_373285 [Alternaria rosae]KAH6882415.1 hypothetical protein BKA58DRAFT_373285 [Alternaria rosae]
MVAGLVLEFCVFMFAAQLVRKLATCTVPIRRTVLIGSKDLGYRIKPVLFFYRSGIRWSALQSFFHITLCRRRA